MNFMILFLILFVLITGVILFLVSRTTTMVNSVQVQPKKETKYHTYDETPEKGIFASFLLGLLCLPLGLLVYVLLIDTKPKKANMALTGMIVGLFVICFVSVFYFTGYWGY